MAKYSVVSLNYITAGDKKCFINMDTLLDYDIPNYVYVLNHENELSTIRTEQGIYEYLNTEYIESESEQPVSMEQSNTDIILHEQQKLINEHDPSGGKLILLKQKTDYEDYQLRLKKFNMNRLEKNRSFVIPLINNQQDTTSSLKNMYKDNSGYINQMYEMRDVSIKSCVYKQQSNQNIKGLDNFFDIYLPYKNSNPIAFCQINQNAIALYEQSSKTPYVLETSIDNEKYEVLNNLYTVKFNNYNINTYLYTQVSDLYCEVSVDIYDENGVFQYISVDTINFNNYSQYIEYIGSQAVQNIFNPNRFMNNIGYNYITNLDQYGNDLNYEKGDIYSESITMGKNSYNSVYSMDVNGDNVLSNARSYCGIGQSNGNVFIKYYDNLTYYPQKYDYQQKTGMTKIDMKKDAEDLYPFQKIELNVPTTLSKSSRHKSNLFSIRIENSNIENIDQDYDVDDQEYVIRNKLKKDIEKDITNSIRDIVNNICPVNTQLFKVYFGS